MNNKKKIAVIGVGYVGKALIEMFKDHYTVIAKDIDGLKIYENGENPKIVDGYDDNILWETVNECDLGVISVPTPFDPLDGHCNTSIVESVVSKLKTPVILIKSTVAPGTCDYLSEKYGKRICFSPEYAGESKYFLGKYEHYNDMKKIGFFIIGGKEEDRKYILNIVKPILGPATKYGQVSAKVAESAKYFENCFYALKVTAFNELKSICDAIDVDFDQVRETYLMDERNHPFHTCVFEEDRGYGGKCFPKDMCGLVRKSIDSGYIPKLFLQAIEINSKLRKEDWIKTMPDLFKDIKDR